MSKGLIFDIRRFTVHDGPGIRTTIFFKGCPLYCRWCHNPESQLEIPESYEKTIHFAEHDFKEKIGIGEWKTVDEVMTEILKDHVFYDESGGGVTFSGGEPLMQPDFLFELLSSCKSEGLHTAIDTSGYCTRELMGRIMPLADLFLYDIKMVDEKAHEEYTGVSNKMILDNLGFLLENKKRVIIRFPVIPAINDQDGNVQSMINWLLPYKQVIRQVDLLPYHSTGKGKYYRLGKEEKLHTIPEPDPGKMTALASTFRNAGFIVR